MRDYGTNRLWALAQRLIALTEQGKVSWSEGAAADSFQLAASSASVTIASRDADGRAPFQLDVYSDSGTVVDSLESELRWDEEAQVDYPAEWNDALETLYERAKRSALNIDTVIDSLIAELPEPDTAPPF
ncbi:MAG TPA: hypothetical protein VNQ77_14125 [Frankiaceae bacterium]|nr:hypothetical protein [Frankiaceae bacterium]